MDTRMWLALLGLALFALLVLVVAVLRYVRDRVDSDLGNWE